MNISKEKFEEARAIAQTLEARIKELKEQGLAPTVVETLELARLHRILDEAWAEFEAELDSHAQWEAHRYDFHGYDDTGIEDLFIKSDYPQGGE